jgi:hypothetical protein
MIIRYSHKRSFLYDNFKSLQNSPFKNPKNEVLLSNLLRQWQDNGFGKKLDLFYTGINLLRDSTDFGLNIAQPGLFNLTLTEITVVPNLGLSPTTTGNSFASTGWNPAVDSKYYSSNKNSIYFSHTPNIGNTNQSALGCSDGTNSVYLNPREGGQFRAVNNGINLSNISRANITGETLMFCERVNSTQVALAYENVAVGAQRGSIISNLTTNNAVSIPSRIIYLCARNNNGTPSNNIQSAYRFSFFAIGAEELTIQEKYEVNRALIRFRSNILI